MQKLTAIINAVINAVSQNQPLISSKPSPSYPTLLSSGRFSMKNKNISASVCGLMWATRLREQRPRSTSAGRGTRSHTIITRTQSSPPNLSLYYCQNICELLVGYQFIAFSFSKPLNFTSHPSYWCSSGEAPLLVNLTLLLLLVPSCGLPPF